MNTREEILAYGLSFPDTYQNAPFRDPNWQLVRVRNTKKAFLWTYEKDGLLHINVKVDPEWRDFWREAFTAVQPGYHQNKEHWNTVVIDGTVPEDTLKRMIAESYDLVSDSPTQRIYQAVRQIPRGKVATWRCRGDGGQSSHGARGRKCTASQSGPGTYSMLSRCQCERRIGWGICFWWGKCAGRSAPGGWNRSEKWSCGS